MFKKIIPSKPFTYSPNGPAPVRLVPGYVAVKANGQKLVAHFRVMNGLGRYCGLDKAS